MTPSQTDEAPSFILSQVPLNQSVNLLHIPLNQSVIAPQFFIIAITPAIAVITAPIINVVGPPRAMKPTIIGINKVNAAVNPPIATA